MSFYHSLDALVCAPCFCRGIVDKKISALFIFVLLYTLVISISSASASFLGWEILQNN